MQLTLRVDHVSCQAVGVQLHHQHSLPAETRDSIDAAYVVTVCTGLPQHLHTLLKGSHAGPIWHDQSFQRHLQPTN